VPPTAIPILIMYYHVLQCVCLTENEWAGVFFTSGVGGRYRQHLLYEAVPWLVVPGDVANSGLFSYLSDSLIFCTVGRRRDIPPWLASNNITSISWVVKSSELCSSTRSKFPNSLRERHIPPSSDRRLSSNHSSLPVANQGCCECCIKALRRGMQL
jgi:hypothetical protein